MTSRSIVRDVPLDQVHVPASRLRDFDPAWAEALALSIGEQGLLQPIVVRPRPRGGCWLVAGRYRLEAVRLLGHVTIQVQLIETADDAAALEAEALENLARAELLALDRCRALFELKALHEAAHPEARHGGDRRSAKAREGSSGQDGHLIDDQRGEASAAAFAQDLAPKIGMSDRAIRRCITIWERLSPASRRRLVGTPLAANQSELQLLSEQPLSRQGQILDLILDPGLSIDGVRAALDHIEGATAETPVERRFRLYCEGFGGLSEPQVDHLLTLHEAAVLTSLRRRGVI